MPIAWRLSWLVVSYAAAFVIGEQRQAIASCGDYVMVGGHYSRAPEPTAPLTPATVCHGPDCRKQAPSPVLPSRGLPPARNVERACHVLACDPPGIATAWLAPDDRALPLAGHQFRIEHPPRQCA